MQQKIIWEDWDEDTVSRFLQYMYTGEYEFPYPSLLANVEENRNSKDSPEPSPKSKLAFLKRSSLINALFAAPIPPEDGWSEPRVPLDLGKGPLVPITSRDYSAPRLAVRLTHAQEFTLWPGHQLWSSKELDYEATLLAHAKIYSIADCFMLDELKSMAVESLREALTFIGCPNSESGVISDVITLIEYVYAHTNRLVSEEEPLRKLVTTFAASNYTNMDGQDFQTLMSRGGDFVLDLVPKLMHRLSWYETDERSRIEKIKKKRERHEREFTN